MSSKTPVVRQIAWISLIPQFIVIWIIMFFWAWMDDENYIILGALTYLIIFLSLRRLIARDHRKGIRMIRKGKFEEAIPYFEKSYEFFKSNTWIDKYRYITMLTPSKISYREMALNNIAFSYTQIGNGQMARKYYEETLAQFPESGLAKVGLNFLDSARESDKE